MTPTHDTEETDPVRAAIHTAIDRLLHGRHRRSSGRLNVTQLAIEAGVARWRLTHQHPDLKDHFQRLAADRENNHTADHGAARDLAALRHRHTELQAHCRMLEEQLQTYATVISLLALENANLAGRAVDTAKLHLLPRRPAHLP